MDEPPKERRKDKVLRETIDKIGEIPFGIVTQRGYEALEKRIDEHAQEVEDRFHKWFVIGLVAFSIIALTSAAGLVGFGILLDRQKDFTEEIQDQRKASIIDICRDQNKRHDDTYSALIVAAKVDEDKQKTQAGKREVRRRRDVTLALIDVLAPHQECDLLAERAVQNK